VCLARSNLIHQGRDYLFDGRNLAHTYNRTGQFLSGLSSVVMAQAFGDNEMVRRLANPAT
jgi:hypothetical protein